jgi:hypothetical protein
MTATLQPESKSTSRRALLVGALGGIGAWAASAIGRAGPVRAGVDGDVVLGATNTSTTPTKISNLTAGDIALWGENSTGAGVKGSSTSGIGAGGNSISSIGVAGLSETDVGVRGDSTSGVGVYGLSLGSSGVQGDSAALGQPAMMGRSLGNGTGVLGMSASAIPPVAKAKTGVYGYAAQDKYSRGVTGESPAGIGVYGISTTGYGVYSAGKIYTTQFYELSEIATPATPVANRARLFLKDNGLGKTQVCVKFANGTVKVLATEG